ncbi:hypothetical protein BF486P3_00038 [Bacteroides phage BF486P3]|nr:hypothetical protein BF486P2_00038 [Bacteroides phage BF486P2]WAX06863.1 hypothetical protein BF486P3_00038 [Bacteroides phage BF486P3]WAX06910.1 hypothetical protein BF494P1_00024 [Bacteroides phage BF494P1]
MKRLKIVLQAKSDLFEAMFDSFMNRCVRERQKYSTAFAYTFHLRDGNDEIEIVKLLHVYFVNKQYDVAAIIRIVVYEDDKVLYDSKASIELDENVFKKATENGVKKFISYKEYARACNIIGATLAIILIIVMLLYYIIKLRILVA